MTDNALKIQNLSAGYRNTTIVKDLSLDIPKGRFTALLGPNGCGKSTLLRSMAGLQPIQQGEVLLEGRALSSFGTKALARRLAILSQGAQAPEGLTVEDLVRQGRYPHRMLFAGWGAEDEAGVEQALELTQTGHLRHRLLAELSGGQRQRAWIAMTLAQQGEILLLDEPTSYLDLSHQIEVLSLVRKLVDTQGVTVVAVLHDLNQAARYADHMVLLKQGQLHVLGRPDEVIRAEHVAEVFGVETRVIPDPETGTPLCIPKRDHPKT